MDIALVVSALSEPSGAGAQCRGDLEHGARLVVLPGLVDAGEIRVAYRRRAEHLEGQGVESADAFEVAAKLEATPHTELALGKVEGGPSGRRFQLFFDPRLKHVIACLALPRTEEPTG